MAWDWKTIIGVSGVLVFVLLITTLVVGLPDWVRNVNSKKLSNRTSGQLISIQPIQQLMQGKLGNKLSTEGYTITYSYTVGQIEYKGTDNVPNSIQNADFLNSLGEYSPNRPLYIKYDPLNPNRSQIDLSAD